MKKFRVTYKDGNMEIIEADMMQLTPTGGLIFIEIPTLVRGQQARRGEIIIAISEFLKVEKLFRTLTA
jgi:hypothetical protein